VAILIVMAASGCGGQAGLGARPDSAPEIPPVWDAAVDAAPPGYQRVSCTRVASSCAGRAVSLALPRSYEPDPPEDGRCQFGGPGISIELVVAPSGTLASYRCDVAVFATRMGGTLAYGIANDGLGGDIHLVQADGVRIRFDTAEGGLDQASCPG